LADKLLFIIVKLLLLNIYSSFNWYLYFETYICLDQKHFLIGSLI